METELIQTSKPQFSEHVRRYLESILRRYGQRMESVAVRFYEFSGPRGAASRSCALRVALKNFPEIEIIHRAPNNLSALGGAAEELEILLSCRARGLAREAS